MIKTTLSYIVIFLFCCSLCNGQSWFAHEVQISYFQSVAIQNYDKRYTSQIGLVQPSILGNMELINTGTISYFKPNYSERFTPGVSLSFSNYSFTDELRDFYFNIKMNNISFGIGGKYKLLSGSSMFSIHGIGELGLGVQNLTFLENYFDVNVEDEETNSTYYTQVKFPKRNSVFLSPQLKIGINISVKILENVSIRAHTHIKSTSYPHFDLDSPILFFEVYQGVGVSYYFRKNKRYYL